jgi:hypothetical protein
VGSQQLLLGSKGTFIAPGVITLSDQLLVNNTFGPLVRVGYELTHLGVVNHYKWNSGAAETRTPLENWVAPLSAAALYEVYVSDASGDGPINGTMNAWLPLTTTYLWYVEANSAIFNTALGDLNVTIRRVGQTTPEETAYIDLRAHI